VCLGTLLKVGLDNKIQEAWRVIKGVPFFIGSTKDCNVQLPRPTGSVLVSIETNEEGKVLIVVEFVMLL
jgi:hypothetical protein